MPDSKRLSRLSGEVAIVGIGETDYVLDYRRARNGEHYSDSYGYASIAFKRALEDCGLTRDDIDGLIVGPTLAYERLAEVLGVNPRWASQGDAINSVIQGVMAIESGLAECVALIYGNDQRTAGTQYGGPQAMGGDQYLSYVYYSPWGMTSQGALYAMMTQRYMQLYGLTEKELGEVAVAQRQFAQLNENAIMRSDLSIEKYLNSKYISEPLHLYDYCLINDGGVALILTTKERAEKMKMHHPTYISGIGRSDMNSDATSLRPRLMDFYHQGHKDVAKQVYNMAGVEPKDINSLQIYDSFSCHIIYALEGFGFCPTGEVGSFIQNGAIGPGGKLPINTSGGHLSESYMQGWNHQIEAVKQIRGEAGKRQVEGCHHVQYIADVAGKVISVIYRRGY
jgi:acetyl-CoA acetyltransferase